MMTTIAYHHEDQQIAYESRSTRGDVIISDKAAKRIDKDGVSFFMCGSVADYDLLLSIYFGGKETLVPECNAYAISDEGCFRIGVSNDGEFWRQKLEHNEAMGSGWQWAISAMDFGKSAGDAVEYAKTRDSMSGGEVHVFQIGDTNSLT